MLTLVFTSASWLQRTQHLSQVWQRAEFSLLDLAFWVRGHEPVSDAAVIVAIDERTLDEQPKIFERRAELARLVQGSYDAGARVVAIDLLMQSPEYLLSPPLTERVRAWHDAPVADTPPEADALIQAVYEETLGDAHLVEALRSGPSILAFLVGMNVPEVEDDRALKRGSYGQVVAGDYQPPRADGAVMSLASLNKAAKRLGNLRLGDSEDGATRNVAIASRLDKRLFAPMGVQLAATELGVSRGLMVYRADHEAIELGERTIPSDRGAMWLNWRGDEYPKVSAVDVIEGIGAEKLKDKIAIVAIDLVANDQDVVYTPFGTRPGVAAHLNLMDNILHDDLLTRAPPAGPTGLAFIAGLLCTLPFLMHGLRWTHVVGVVAGAGVTLVVPQALFVGSDIWLESLGAKAAVVACGIGCMSTAWLQEGAQSRALKAAFAQYVSDDLLAVIARDPTLVSLQGQRRELSILFSDIRDFTSHSERMDPLELVAFLNTYLTPMTRAVLDQRGFVDKFIGDAVMALFGAPVPDADHASQAARAALHMYKALDSIRPAAEKHDIDLAIGVGINSGVVALGNLGSADRFEYTVLGDSVNLASRLEGLTKNYGVFCLIGANTAAQLGPEFRRRTIDLVRVKGKHEPVEIFELTGDDEIVIAWYEGIDLWNQAIDRWRAGDFPGARESFVAFQEANPDDPAVALYLERLEQRPEAPEDWDGVFTHTKK